MNRHVAHRRRISVDLIRIDNRTLRMPYDGAP
jgi:hypothetical protein